MFINVQIPWSGFSRNSFEAGLKDMEEAGLEGLYGYDPKAPGSEHPKLAADYFMNGTPWTVVIDRKGVVRYTASTEAAGPISKVIQASVDRTGGKKKGD